MSSPQRTGRPKFNHLNNFRFNNGIQNKQNFVVNPVSNNLNQRLNQGRIQPHNRDALIARNLEHMKQVAHKKKLAQAAYYGTVNKRNHGEASQHLGRSVQERLGPSTTVVQQKFTRRFNNINNNNYQNVLINRKNGPPMFQQKNKLLRIQSYHVRMQPRQNINVNNKIKTVDNKGKVLYLRRRTMPLRKMKNPVNLSIQVKNDGKHHIQSDLNPQLQHEIRLIQSRSPRQEPQIMLNSALHHSMKVEGFNNTVSLMSAATKQTMHERFSMI